jgi:hypothetical protein
MCAIQGTVTSMPLLVNEGRGNEFPVRAVAQ